jgi:dTDP-4-amino-4,6-dideoxygalactose transaminase
MRKPALEGGKPQRKSYLPYGHHKLTTADLQQVERVLKSNWITQGPVVDEFEKVFAKKIGCNYAVSLSSGTAAIHTAMASLGLKAGDEVLTTPLTFIATINSILYVGAKPVLADIDPNTMNLDPKDVERRVTGNARAVIFVHFTGSPAGFRDVIQISQEHGLKLVDDASHALGAKCNGKMVGSFEESVSTFSFHPVKHVTTGEGGMLTTASTETAEFAKTFRNHGLRRVTVDRSGSHTSWTYDVGMLGWNYRLNDIGSALGISQLRRLESGLAKRAAIARFYSKEFRDIPQIKTPAIDPDVKPAWHLYTIVLQEDGLKIDRDRFIEALRAENIGAALHYPPAHLFSYHRERLGFKEGDFPVAESISRRIVSLPIFPTMTRTDRGDVVEAVRKVVEFYTK